MKLFVWFLGLGLCSFVGIVDAGDQIGNGAGLAEQRFEFALAQTKNFAELAISSRGEMHESDRSLLKDILDDLDEERAKNFQLLQFISERSNRGFFVIDGQEKVARTGLSVGDTIYVNLDMIYRHTLGGTEAMPISEAVGVVFHELAHHQGIEDEARLERFGAAMSSWSNQLLDRSTLVPFGFSVNSFSQYTDPDSPTTRVWFEDGEALYEVSRLIEARIPCSSRSARTVRHAGLISGLHWTRQMNPHEGGARFVVKGYLEYSLCATEREGRMPIFEQLGPMEITLSVPTLYGIGYKAIDSSAEIIIELRKLSEKR